MFWAACMLLLLVSMPSAACNVLDILAGTELSRVLASLMCTQTCPRRLNRQTRRQLLFCAYAYTVHMCTYIETARRTSTAVSSHLTLPPTPSVRPADRYTTAASELQVAGHGEHMDLLQEYARLSASVQSARAHLATGFLHEDDDPARAWADAEVPLQQTFD